MTWQSGLSARHLQASCDENALHVRPSVPNNPHDGTNDVLYVSNVVHVVDGRQSARLRIELKGTDGEIGKADDSATSNTSDAVGGAPRAGRVFALTAFPEGSYEFVFPSSLTLTRSRQRGSGCSNRLVRTL